MSLAHTYRVKLAARQNRQFWLFLGLAIAIHGIGAAGLRWGNPQHWLNFLTVVAPKQEITPIDFVYVESEEQAPPTPAQTNRRAQTNATAAARNQTTVPVQPGQPDASRITGSAGVPSANSTAPSPSLARPIQAQPTPQPAISPSPISSPFARTPEPLPTPASLPPLPSRPPLSSRPTSQLPVSPAPTASASASSPTSPTAPLGGPIARSVTIGGEGLSGANADRSGTGTAVDATRDDQWGSYLSALNRMVDQNWQRVSVEATRRTKIQFRVDRQGHLTDLQLLQSSGDTLADQAAMQAVRAAAPFAPLPQNTTEEVLIVNFTFTQWLHSDSP